MLEGLSRWVSALSCWSCRLRYHLGLFTSRLILYMAPYFKSDLLTFADAFGITNIRNQESGSLHVIAATVHKNQNVVN